MELPQVAAWGIMIARRCGYISAKEGRALTSKEQDVARSIYRAFDPAPLNTGQSNLYVDLDQVRGVSQGASTLVQTLARRIQLSDGKPTCQVLAGHKGSGKSTELYRLQRELQEGTPQHFVVFCKSDDDIDRNDVDFPEVLIAIVRQLATQLKEREEIDLAPGPFRKAIQGISAIANGIEIDKFQLGNGLLTLGGQIRSSPDQRREVRKALEPHTDSLLGAANDVISEAFQKLTAKGYKGIVVLVDDLDKMVVRALDTGQQTDEYLFVNRSAQLAAFRCHVVYTM
ncbi:MAG: hypothetical protein FJY92_10665, partial [Candidatus Hydrogenedentes bacterium]|nr:hypothetical protein [Candidatus Hydrogenedentota bacterium]